MAKFKDSLGRIWNFPEFTEGHVIAIRRAFGIDWHKVIDRDEAEVSKAFTNSAMAEMILFLLAAELEKAGVTPDELAMTLNHTARQEASRAVVECVMDFFHGPELAKKMAAAIRPEMEKQKTAALSQLKKQYGDSLE